MKERWRAENPERQKEVLMRLSRGDSSFTELYDYMKSSWARQTLSLYLKDLVEKHYIKKVIRGKKRLIYSLNRENPKVAALLDRIIIHGRVELKTMSEQEVLDSWIESMKFSLLNVIQIYMTIGKGRKELTSTGTGETVPIETFLAEYMTDLLEVCRYHGEFLAKGIKMGDLDPKLIWEARNELLDGIKRRRSIKT